MSKSLIIAEKPSVASDLARALGKFKREKDFFENDQYVISSAVGHLVEMVPPEGAEVKRGKWNLENLPVLPNHFDLVPIEKNKGRLQVLKRLLKRPDVAEIINACDAGRCRYFACGKRLVGRHQCHARADFFQFPHWWISKDGGRPRADADASDSGRAGRKNPLLQVPFVLRSLRRIWCAGR